jgi:hypothetical protein
MERFVIIEKLKELIGSRSVTAAVFYTFNFDSRFFENYLLPVFVPNAPFSEIEIQNNILWRKYASVLPPVTVYCDFHAKSNDAPTLGYTIRTIDLKTLNGIKPCFHPKNSLILLDDWTLIVMTGSANLSVGGWCTNVEGISIFEMRNGIWFPYSLKHALWNFMLEINNLSGHEYSKAEKEIENFFSQRKHTPYSDKRFYYSTSGNIARLFSELKTENTGMPFARIEVISPYISPSPDFIKITTELSNDNLIYTLTPYNATNVAEVTLESYNTLQAAGIVWSRLLNGDDDKIFRFNHSKIYRLKGELKMFIIIGSANYTEAGWKGFKKNGNIESAVVYTEPVTNWQDWLIAYNNPEIQFSANNGDESDPEQRHDAPDLQFSLDWLEKKLIYNHAQTSKFSGKIILTGNNYEIKSGNNIEVLLNDIQVDALAENSVIKVRQYTTQHEFYFFPILLNNESRPYSSKLKLNDRELIELWQKVSVRERNKNEIIELLDRFISLRLDSEGDLLNKPLRSKSTLNMIASHIYALISLERRLFDLPSRVGEYAKSKEMIDYYLFTNNLDTLTGYRNLLKEMLQEGVILPGVMWFLLNLLLLEFYDHHKISRAYDHLRIPSDCNKNLILKTQQVITAEMKALKKSIRPGEIPENMYKWIMEQMHN